MSKFRTGDRVSVMGTVGGYSNTLVRVHIEGGSVHHLHPERLTLVDRKPREPAAPAVVKYGSKTYIRTALGWIMVHNGLVVGSKLRTFEQMLEWENITFRPAIERYWAERYGEEPGHGEPF